MPIRIRVEAPTLSAEAVAAFRTDAQVCFAIYRRLRRRYRLPACQIAALLAEDFTEAVEQHFAWRRAAHLMRLASAAS